MLIQKARHLYTEEALKTPKHIGHTYMVFEKHDGWYGYMDLIGTKIMSRQMREIPSLKSLSSELSKKRPNMRGRLIFEIMIEGLEYDSFYELNGILNRHEQAEDVYLRVHDFIPDFQCDVPKSKRYEMAKHIVEEFNDERVRMSPILLVTSDVARVRKVCETVWSWGGEGIIMARLDAPYSPDKRNFDLMKIKEEVTLDLLVVGMEGGEGKYEGTLGALIVKDKAGNQHRVSGMSDDERDVWWTNRDLIMGKVVEVKAMKRDKRTGALREPRYKAQRFDKAATEID